MKEYKKVFVFLSYSLSLCIGWFVIYDLWLSSCDSWLTLKLANISAFFLSLIGYNANAVDSVVLIDSREMVYIGSGCNGMVLMALFAGFIIAFPGPILKKSIFILIGFFIINLLNVVRIAALALNSLYSQDTVEFNHKYTFTILVYATIFVLWMFWVKKVSNINSYAPTTASEN